MKKTIKYLVFSLLMLFGFSLNVNAETLPAAVDGKITLDKNYTIDSVTFSSTSDVKVIDLNGKTLTLNGTLKVKNSIEVKDGKILRNSSNVGGPLVWVEGKSSNLTLNNVIVDGNKVECNLESYNVGVFSFTNASVTVNNSTFINHYNTKAEAAALFSTCSKSLIIKNSNFKNNKLFGKNGGVAILAKDLEKVHISGSIIENNYATIGNGIISIERVDDLILDKDCIVRNNEATGASGMRVSDSNAIISGTFESNKAISDNGAGLYTIFVDSKYSDRVMKITKDAKFINNESFCAGGALYVNSDKTNIPGKVIIEGATFSGNKSLGTVDASDGLFKDIGGGAIAVARGILEINDIKMSDHTAAINKGNSIIVSHANGNANGGKLLINGGEFDNTIDLGVGSIVVNGGTFKQDMSKYITNTKLISKKTTNGYEVVENIVLENDNISFENEEAMDKNFELVITEKETDKELVSDINSVVKKEVKGAKDIKVLAMYDISVSDGTNPVEMKDGKFKITINLDEKLLKYNSYAGVYVDDDGKVTYVPVEVKDGKAVITTSHLSTYGVVGYNIPNPATNSNVEIIVSIILFALMFAGIGLSMKKKEVNA